MPSLPEVVSAQVLVADAGAGNLDRLRRAWAAAGFDPGPAVGGTFAIAASVRHFEAVFATRLAVDAEGGVLADSARALPLAHLPKALRSGVELVTFGRPPRFGPGER